MILLLDAGNARIKLGRLADGELTPIGAVVHRDVGLGPLMTELEQLSGPVQRVVACCVAGPSVRRELETAIRGRFGIATEFVTAERQAAGVTNAYPQPGRLGADRWCAVIGAHAHGLGVQAVGLTCVVQGGSANAKHMLIPPKCSPARLYHSAAEMIPGAQAIPAFLQVLKRCMGLTTA